MQNKRMVRNGLASRMRNKITYAAVGATLALIGSAAHAGTVISIPVSEDVTINRANPLSNLNSITVGGGLLVGLDDTGSDYSFYAKFKLPALASGESITSATLSGIYNSPIGGASRSSIFGRLVEDDSWTETGITADNAPTFKGDVVAGLDTFALAVGGHSFTDLGLVTVVNQEARGDGVLSLRFDTVDGRFNDLQNFSSRESGMGGGFRLDVETSKVKPIPLPPAAFSVLGMIPVGAAYLWRRRHARTSA